MEFNGEIRVNCKKLMERVTKKKVSEEWVNLAICQLRDCIDYVTEPDVKLSIEGLHHKFVIHAEHEKSRRFRKLVDKFIELTKPEGLSHPTWSILHLLFRLSYRPTERPDYLQDLEGQICENIEIKKKDDLDWIKYLQEGQSFQSLPKRDDSWTDSDEEPTESENKSILIFVPNDKIHIFKKTPQDNLHRPVLGELIQENYWDREPVWTEFQLLHELLWALQSRNGLSSLFELCPNGRIRARKISLAGLPSPCLNQFLSTLYPLIEGLKLFNAFIDDVASALQQTYTLTHQAYAAALNTMVVGQFCQSLSEFEQQVAEQKITLTLTHLQPLMKRWQLIIPPLAEIHLKIVQIPASVANHIRTAGLLSALFNSAHHAQIASYLTLYPVLLQLLSASLVPILNMIDHWFTRGEIVDPFQEFSIERNSAISPQDERFWLDALLVRPGQLTVDFLQPLMEDIVLAGRSVELLSHLGHRPSSNSSSIPQLADVFRLQFNSRFSSVLPPTVPIPPPLPLSPLNFKTDNPLLKEAFHTFRESLQRGRRTSEPEKLLQTPPEFYPLLPLLEQSLLEPIRSKQRAVSKSLLGVLYDQCAMRAHILALRRIHFMQAGDLMDRFCLQLFHKVDTDEKWESESYLTLSLINSLSSRMSHSLSCVSVTLSKSSTNQAVADLSRLNINYAVPWPVNLIINQESLSLYNSVFQFLLKIKRALTSLQRLSFKEMNTMESVSPIEKLSATGRQHRLQLLRAWLLHFVTSLEHYIMECVLESSHAQFDIKLEEATHLGQIADSHQQYIRSVYNQCLQQPAAAFLRDAINEVLSISSTVAKAWTVGIQSAQLVQLEDSYVRHHQYIASVLATDAAHSMLPHVETLTTALTHSCPSST